MAVEISEDKKKLLKDIYNDSVRLLELLNVLIPKVETYDPKVPVGLCQEISDKCFELGANIATNVEELEEQPQLEVDQNTEEEDPFGYPFGI